MSTSVRFRRGTTAEHATFTGAAGEMTVDTTKNTLVVHDGATAGGVPLARASDLSSYKLITDRAYADIHVHDNATAQSIPNGTTYTKITATAENGEYYGATPDAANDKITITKAGKYLVNCSINAGSGTNNITFKFAAFLGGAEMHQVHAHRKYAVADDLGSCSMTGIIDVASVPADLDIRARHDGVSAVNLTVTYANLNAVYLGA